MQRRIISLIEAGLNTGFGFFISVVAGVYVYPVFGLEVTILQVTGITGIFTAISVLRGYIVRRLFNFAHIRGWR